MELRGRRALVTGAGIRVGRSIAETLMRRGVHVAVHYAHSADAARAVAGLGASLGVNTVTLAADLGDADAARALAATAAAALGGLDILVNNAAIMEQQQIPDVAPADWDRAMNLNLRGPFFVAQGAAAAMPAGGAIVNIADLAAFERWTSYAVHCISKAGIVVMTELMAKAFAPRIRVNAIAPGVTMSEATKKIVPDFAIKGLKAGSPMGMTLEPDDLTGTAVYLACEDSRLMTGQTLVVDAGVWLNG